MKSCCSSLEIILIFISSYTSTPSPVCSSHVLSPNLQPSPTTCLPINIALNCPVPVLRLIKDAPRPTFCLANSSLSSKSEITAGLNQEIFLDLSTQLEASPLWEGVLSVGEENAFRS